MICGLPFFRPGFSTLGPIGDRKLGPEAAVVLQADAGTSSEPVRPSGAGDGRPDRGRGRDPWGKHLKPVAPELLHLSTSGITIVSGAD